MGISCICDYFGTMRLVMTARTLAFAFWKAAGVEERADLARGRCVAALWRVIRSLFPQVFESGLGAGRGGGGDGGGLGGENPGCVGFSAAGGLTPFDGDSIPVSAATSTASQSTSPAPSGGSPSTTHDQYRSPQTCPDLPRSRLKRTENVCFNHCMIAGSCNPSAGLI
jgi:hypothetical protein